MVCLDAALTLLKMSTEMSGTLLLGYGNSVHEK